MRTINFLDDFINDNGCFKAFADFVRTHDELELLLRGNSGTNGIVNIYYNNNIVWSLKRKKTKAYVTVNYNHLRYSENWLDIIGIYNKEFGFPLKTVNNLKADYSLGYYSSSIDVAAGEVFSSEFVSDMYNIISDVMNDYFYPYQANDEYNVDDPRLLDQFRLKKDGSKLLNKNGSLRKKPNYLEKQNQQAYYSQTHLLQNGLFVYDLEYKEPFESIKEKEKQMAKKQRESMNKPDCLGIRFDENGKPCKFVMIEMKSNAEAEKGHSGTEEHLDGMMDDLSDSKFVKDRIDEAQSLLEQYKKLQLRGFGGKETIPRLADFLSERTTEILFVYTDSLAHGKTVGTNNIAISKKYKEGIRYSVELFKKNC